MLRDRMTPLKKTQKKRWGPYRAHDYVRRMQMRVVKKPEERRAEMVSAASKLFAQQGFVKTSVAEIVSAVDVA